MKLKLCVIIGALSVVTFLSGCTESAGSTTAPTVAGKDTSEVELVPARKSDESSKRELVVEKDGKFYEMLKEHERLCHDCDR